MQIAIFNIFFYEHIYTSFWCKYLNKLLAFLSILWLRQKRISFFTVQLVLYFCSSWHSIDGLVDTPLMICLTSYWRTSCSVVSFWIGIHIVLESYLSSLGPQLSHSIYFYKLKTSRHSLNLDTTLTITTIATSSIILFIKKNAPLNS